MKIQSYIVALIKSRFYAASLLIHIALIILLSFFVLTQKLPEKGAFQLERGLLVAPGISNDTDSMGPRESIETATISTRSLVMPRIMASQTQPINLPQVELATTIGPPTGAETLVLKDFTAGKGDSGSGSGAGNIWSGTGVNAGPGRKINFFGIQDEAERVVFLIDISGSMVSADKGGYEGFSRVKQEFRSLIENLYNQSSFNVILFGSQAFCFQSQTLVQATPENKDAAYQWILPIHDSKKEFHNTFDQEMMDSLYVPTIRGMPQGGGTRMDLALLAAFEMKPDVIFVLSDGAPNIAGWNIPEVLNKVGSWKKLIFLNQKEPKIHVVSYEADGAGNNFMQSLASRNSGKFLRVKGFKTPQFTLKN